MTPPDSGEREVPCCDLRSRGHRDGCPGIPASVKYRVVEQQVSLPLLLAQRILAALTGAAPMASWRERDALAAELRAVMPK